MNNLVLVLQYQGKYEAAEEMNRRALEGREKVLGKEHPSSLTSVYCVALLFYEQQQYTTCLDLPDGIRVGGLILESNCSP